MFNIEDSGKIVLCASAGGHLSQVLQIANVIDIVRPIILTEKRSEISLPVGIKEKFEFYYLYDCVGRRDKAFWTSFVNNIWISYRFLKRKKASHVIATGAAISIPVLAIAKLLGARTIFVESYAKVSTKTLSGAIAYRFVDEFYVQWPSMLSVYPAAIYKGSLY